jgi:hypothetical protein
MRFEQQLEVYANRIIEFWVVLQPHQREANCLGVTR